MYMYIFIIIFFLYLIYKNYRYNDLKYIDQCSLNYNRDRIYEFENLLNEDECVQIINMAKPLIKRSTVMAEQKIQDIRTSSHTFLQTNNNPLLKKLNNIIYNYLKIFI